MKRVFNFGKIDFYGKGRRSNAVTVEMKYTEQDGKKRFSVSGNIWNGNHSDIVCGGQCLDEIARYVKTPLFREIRRLWKLYHLNDMHPACVHQAAQGWEESAGETVTIYKWKLTGEAMKAQREAKRRILRGAENGETVTATEEEKRVLPLSYSMESAGERLSDDIAPYYMPDGTKTERRGWLRYEEDSRGILGKPCPVCGYKYGHGWNYFPIPADDETIILRLLNEGV